MTPRSVSWRSISGWRSLSYKATQGSRVSDPESSPLLRPLPRIPKSPPSASSSWGRFSLQDPLLFEWHLKLEPARDFNPGRARAQATDASATSLQARFQQSRQAPAPLVDLLLHDRGRPDRVEGPAGLPSLLPASAGNVPAAGLDRDLFEVEALMGFAGDRQDLVGHLLGPGIDVTRQLPILGLLLGQPGRNRRVFDSAKGVLHRLAVPIAVELSSGLLLALDQCEQGELVPSLIREPRVVGRRLKGIPVGVEVFSAHVERLVDVPQIVRQEDDCDRPGDSAIVGLGHLALQDANAERDQMDDVEFRPPDLPIAILLISGYRDVRKVKLMMRGVAAAWIGREEGHELVVDALRNLQRLRARRPCTVVEAFDLVGKRRDALQGQTLQELFDRVRGLLIVLGQPPVGDGSHQAMPARAVGLRAAREEKDGERNSDQRFHLVSPVHHTGGEASWAAEILVLPLAIRELFAQFPKMISAPISNSHPSFTINNSGTRTPRIENGDQMHQRSGILGMRNEVGRVLD